MDNRKSIFILVSQTGTILSRIIRILTKDDYNHASIALDNTLEEMYSFGRKHPYNPVWGGFVRESTKSGTFKRFRETRIILIQIDVSSNIFDEVNKKLEQMYSFKGDYRYNYIGLIGALFNKSYKKERCYYCSEFVKEVLVNYNIASSKEFKKIVKPVNFLKLNKSKIVFEGYMKEYIPASS